MYGALMVDLKGSRDYEPERRNALQQYLVELTEILNLCFASGLERRLEFNGGDEIQGLFTRPADALLCLRLLRRAIFPVPIHGGIGVGEWTVRTPERDTFYQDGPVYHRAREAIELAKKERDYRALMITGRSKDMALNAVLNGIFALTEGNSSHQNDLALLVELLYPIVSPEGSLDLSGLLELAELLSRRGELCEGGKPAKLRPEAFSEAVRLGPRFLGESWAEARNRNSSACYSCAHPYGAASAAAALAGLKRQAVDTALRAAKVYEERSLTLALLELLPK